MNVKGKLPTSGTLTLNNECSVTAVNASDGTFTATLNNGKVEIANCGGTNNSNKICTLKNGTALAIGSEYECDPGDGTNRTFFVLENTDATKVSLIMDRNIDDTTIPFCDQSNDSTKTNAVACQADALQAKIASTTSDWTKVTVTLPAANQIAKVTNTNVWDSTTSTSSFCFGSQASNQYKWLYNYTNGCSSYGCDESTSLTSGANGYWTSSLCSGNSSCAWGARKDGCLIGSSVSRDNNFGVRPVIIISKSNIS